MAGMAALQYSLSALSLTSGKFLGQSLPQFTQPSILVNTTYKPCVIVMKLKHWERKECKPNSLPVLHKMHVKVGDTVKVIAGREKGKTGEIAEIFRHNSTVIVRDVNLKTKHVKPKEEGEKGEIIKIEGPIHSSNVMLYSKEKEVTSRVGHRVLEDGSRVRYLIKTGEIIDSSENWKKLKEEKSKTKVAAVSAS